MLVRYGMCNTSSVVRLDERQKYRYILKCYLLWDFLPYTLKEALDKIDFNTDRHGFSSDGMEWDSEEQEQSLSVACSYDSSLSNMCEMWYRIGMTIDYFRDDFPNFPFHDVDDMLLRYQYLQQFDGMAYASVRCDILKDFMDSEPTEKNRLLLALYLGIRSIVGKAEIYRTTSQMMQARMIGAMNADECHEILLANPRLKSVFDFWTTRKRYYGLIDNLMQRKLIVTCKDGNRVAVSCSLSDDEFAQKFADDI